MAAAIVLGGCASSQGDGLMRRGAFAEAEAAYESELAVAPGDRALEAKRDAARTEAVRARLMQSRDMRATGHGDAALSMLGEALRMETRWSLAAPPDLAALRDAEIAAAGDAAESEVRPLLVANAPLASRGRAAKLAPLLEDPRLHPIAERIDAEIASAAKARCAGLTDKQSAETPYLNRAVAAYCAMLGTPIAAKPGPQQRRGLRISGKLGGATAAQQRILEQWLGDAFHDSPWFAAEATEMLPAEFKGGYDVRLDRHRVVLTAPYRQTSHGVVRRPLMAPVDVDTEEEHVFQYEAEQYEARYDLDITVSLDLGAGPPLVVRVTRTESRQALQHDVLFPTANVHPVKANLPDVNSWLASYLAAKRLPMTRKLQGRWVKAFCGGDRPTPEQAAQCVAARVGRPAVAVSLATVFGQDTGLLIEDLTRSRSPEPKPQKGAKPTPEVEEVPPVAGAESI
jgi:hypothetical protein